ncbi:MAG: electron transfer flavoprotein subunit alpha/FixB family protein [Ardenticatenaceae bacterium]|nr:electron transfer flavoprotein subunit alpha/FixB family protein [Ardenticatenaceae bacterium]MCB9442929.1 electron transfer flavoprotein subunit alpha/FixB family protein [Ardenticatenaceae bacterium]
MILGFIDHDRGKLDEISLEMLTLGRQLAQEESTELAAVLIGEAARPLLPQLAAYGVTTTYLIQHDNLDDYAPEAWAQSIVELIGTASPQAVLAPGTDRGYEVLAHVAARLDLPLAANVTAVTPGDEYQVIRLRWGGSLLEEASLKGKPKLLTIAPHALAAEEGSGVSETAVHTITPTLNDKDFRVRVTNRVSSGQDGISLTEARVVVGGGRGVGSPEGFAVLEELATLLHGAVGGSRVATNLGWRPHADQIGQTGTRIAPDLYIACGISGAIQHWVGCKGAKRILAINTDAEAPMVTKANYAVIGDLHEVLPAIIAEIQKS